MCVCVLYKFLQNKIGGVSKAFAADEFSSSERSSPSSFQGNPFSLMTISLSTDKLISRVPEEEDHPETKHFSSCASVVLVHIHRTYVYNKSFFPFKSHFNRIDVKSHTTPSLRRAPPYSPAVCWCCRSCA